MNYDLPKSLEIFGVEYDIRSDYRCILDICAALEDPELDYQEKAIVSLTVFYPDFFDMPAEYYENALKQCFWFINGGSDDTGKNGPTLVSWEQDAQYIIAPINRVLGKEIRDIEYLHWWSFLSAYMEIGDCTFAQIVRIRNMIAKGKNLDKFDKEWYRNNRALVDIKTSYTSEENAVLDQWLKAGK